MIHCHPTEMLSFLFLCTSAPPSLIWCSATIIFTNNFLAVIIAMYPCCCATVTTFPPCPRCFFATMLSLYPPCNAPISCTYNCSSTQTLWFSCRVCGAMSRSCRRSGRSACKGSQGMVHTILLRVITPPGGASPLVRVAGSNAPPLIIHMGNVGMSPRSPGKGSRCMPSRHGEDYPPPPFQVFPVGDRWQINRGLW